ncbi:Hypothetical protein D9617_35g090090 [Elsinoe fawcettii]|nr:Hypothetical protein D9617_35g090090 [Elsinoe fawcettii]
MSKREPAKHILVLDYVGVNEAAPDPPSFQDFSGPYNVAHTSINSSPTPRWPRIRTYPFKNMPPGQHFHRRKRERGSKCIAGQEEEDADKAEEGEKDGKDNGGGKGRRPKRVKQAGRPRTTKKRKPCQAELEEGTDFEEEEGELEHKEDTDADDAAPSTIRSSRRSAMGKDYSNMDWDKENAGSDVEW